MVLNVNAWSDYVKKLYLFKNNYPEICNSAGSNSFCSVVSGKLIVIGLWNVSELWTKENVWCYVPKSVCSVCSYDVKFKSSWEIQWINPEVMCSGVRIYKMEWFLESWFENTHQELWKKCVVLCEVIMWTWCWILSDVWNILEIFPK